MNYKIFMPFKFIVDIFLAYGYYINEYIVRST